MGERIIVTFERCSMDGCERPSAEDGRCQWHKEFKDADDLLHVNGHRIIERHDVGKANGNPPRTHFVADMEPGDVLLFRIRHYSDAASVRGSAYATGIKLARRYSCKRVRADVVAVRRET